MKLLAILLTLSQPAAALTFTASVIDPNGPAKAWGKGSGDLDGDGLVDLLVGGKLGGLYWYRNPSWAKTTISSSARIEEDIAVADMNDDGRNDVVAIVLGGVSWFENAEGWPAHPIVTGRNLHDIEVVDLDGDGKLDLTGRNQGTSGQTLFFWRQITLTTWAAKQIKLPSTGEGLLARDLDRDDKIDITTGQHWFRNHSTPGVLAFTRYTNAAAAPASAFVAAGDVNGDGRVDIVTTAAEPVGGTGGTSSWFEAPVNATDPWLQHILETDLPTVTHFAGVADLDDDGEMDVVTALTEKASSPSIKAFLSGVGPAVTVAPVSSHTMQIIDVDGKRSLLGADYDKTRSTPVRLFMPN